METALAFKMSSGNSSFVLEDEELTLDPEVLADIPAESVESLQADGLGEKKSIAHDIISQVHEHLQRFEVEVLEEQKLILKYL